MQYTKTQFLMWTDVTISIVANENPVDDIYNSFAIFYALEKQFSRFLDDSELSEVNKNKEMEVSKRFSEIFLLSKEIFENTSHYFNPLVNLSNIWYSKDFDSSDFSKELRWDNLDLSSVVLLWDFISLKDNQNLDFWWIVKWYTVDLVSEYLHDKWYSDFIINAWWDIYLSGNNKNWNTPVVWVDNPFNPDKVFATLELKDKAVSTSGTYKRKWNIDNQSYHHILDPNTNENNNEIISISIVADKCYLADVYATTCVAMWIEKSLYFLKENDIDWVIIWSDWNYYQTKGMEKYNFRVI